MTDVKQRGVLARAQFAVQSRRAVPELGHRTCGRFSQVQDIAPQQINLSDDDQWKTFWFVAHDVWDDANSLRCSTTAAVLRAIPHLTTGFFSIRGRGQHIAREEQFSAAWNAVVGSPGQQAPQGQ